jgi:ProP effector
MATLRLSGDVLTKIAPKLRAVGIDPVKAAAEREAQAKAAAAAARKAANLAADAQAHAEAVARKAARAQAIAAAICERWPDLFDRTAPKPLAIGIDRTIAAELGLKRNDMGGVLQWWATRIAYHRAMAAGTVRYNLDGSEAGPISDDDRARAQARCASSAARRAKRKQASAQSSEPMAISGSGSG